MARGSGGTPRRLLVTGSSGFLGRQVHRGLAASPGWSVRGFDLLPPPDHDLVAVVGDLCREDEVLAAAEDVDVIVHFGGIGDVDVATADPGLATRANVVGTANVGIAASKVGAKVVYASTWEVYGRPIGELLEESHPCRPDNVYAATKLAGEQVLAAICGRSQVPVAALRLGTAYGPGMRPNSVFRRFFDAARAGGPITLHGGGRQWRQFVHTRDIVEAVALAVDADLQEATLNVVAPQAVTIRQLAEAVAARYGAPIREAPGRPGDPHPAMVSSAAAAAVLGWKAQVDFADGLAELLTELEASEPPG